MTLHFIPSTTEYTTKLIGELSNSLIVFQYSSYGYFEFESTDEKVDQLEIEITKIIKASRIKGKLMRRLTKWKWI